jgi:hypothetical protein
MAKHRYISVNNCGIGLLGTFLLVATTAFAQQAETSVTDCLADACKAKGGTWSCGYGGVNGDGTSVVAVVATGPPGSVSCGHARTLRQNIDNDFKFNCKVDPPQPPTVANSSQRRCEGDASDMSVESCWSSSGSTASITCTYVNAKNAPSKLVELCGCFSRQLKQPLLEVKP